MKKVVLLCLAFIAAFEFSSCKKESFIKGKEAELLTSDDNLHFDTLFTTTGSTTKYFKIYNKNNRKLLISSISLSGGTSSYFRMNADGTEGPVVSNLEMEANDSLYVFVTVHINQSTTDLPFIIEDSISIKFNGNEQKVKLQAWGQNANFLSAASIKGNTTWTNKRPYVIIGGLLVEENAVLTIEKGTNIYLHANAPVFIDGTIVATGEKYDSTKIMFAGDRLDDPYRDFPAAWPGLYFRDKSKNNLLEHVIVKNAYQGIIAQNAAPNANPKVTMKECIISNCYDAGILGIGSSIVATNCLISNCGKNILLANGGNYLFSYITDAAYSNNLLSHKLPVLTVTNFTKEGNTIIVSDLSAQFTNCIFWGDNGIVPDEVVVLKEGTGMFNVSFTNCLWKVSTPPSFTSNTGILENTDPLFKTIDSRKGEYDFHLLDGSPAIKSGIPTTEITDLEGSPRDPNFPDIGAYESTF